MLNVELLNKASFYLTGFFICLACFICAFTRKKTRRLQNRIYICLILDVMIDAGLAVIGVFAEPYWMLSDGARIFVDTVRFLYFLVHAALAPIFFVFMLYVSASISVHRRHRWRFTFSMFPFLITEILVAVNLFSGCLYYTDEAHVYHRGPLMWVFYASAVIYFILALISIFRYWYAITPKRRKGVLCLYILTIFGIVMQLVEPDLQVEIFAESIGLVCAMIFLESDEERTDVGSGLLNRGALTLDLNSFIRMHQPFYAFVIYVANPDSLNKLTAAVSSERLLGEVAKYLGNLNPLYNVYRTSPNCFVLLGLNLSEREAEKLEETIRGRFSENWCCEGGELILRALVMRSAYPGGISTAEEVFLMSDSPKPVDEAGHLREDAGLEEIKRSINVEQALRRGFEDHNFEVYYQPIYTLENLSIHSAEALIRLHDPELGEIQPVEFIRVAENDGAIDRIGSFVLEEVCLFLSSGLPVEMGIEYICVNLSILQCMRPSFVRYVRDLALRYDVLPSLICFEIKESAAANDFVVLQDTISELKQYGFRFSMDSYGTGFSDMHALYALDFDLIKIDRSLLQRAEPGSMGEIILRSCVRMLRQMRRRILVEGAETREQIELLKQLEVDYVQGYYSSKPITKNELLGILRVTELARMEERRAIAASEAKSSFLANMSHEIRTPINAVLGMNAMILRECDEEAVMNYAREIETAGRNLLSLINNILDYSKIEAGEMEIVEAEYDLKESISDVIRDAYPKTDRKHLTFRVEVSEDLPARLYGDEFRIKQVLINLLNNSVKYTDEGSVHLSVEGEKYSEDELLLIFHVEDTGRGIREEDQSKLYEMFQRLDMVRNRTVEGTGLGLAISYHLLQMMQGEIQVESEYGVGSTFTVQLLQKVVGDRRILPFTPEEMKQIMHAKNEQREFTAADARVLIVDDTPMNHTVLKELLRKTGMRIESALNGADGLEMAKDLAYDLIFMDQRMPGMNGSEVLKKLRASEGAKSRDAKVISMTANAYPGIREAERKEGFDDYIGKPVDRAELMELVHRYLPEDKIHPAGERNDH